MDGYGFPSTASVVAILALVGLLVVASAVALAPFDRLLAGRYAVAFVGCLAASFSREIAYVANVPQANFLENAVYRRSSQNPPSTHLGE